MVIQVKKRDGRLENVAFDKITSRIMHLCSGLNLDYVDPAAVAQKVVQGVYNGVTTVELDNLAAETAAYMTVQHPDYAILAARIAVSNLHKETAKQFSVVMTNLYSYVNPRNKKQASMIGEETYRIVMENADRLNSAVIHSRDYAYNFFGFKTLERSYLLKIDNKVAERPQHMLMRVSVGIHGRDINAAIETYNLMSERFFTHASPTLFNAGTPRPQLSSCFLVAMIDDSIEGIFDTLRACALISKSAGGVGLHVHNIRATGSYIAGTNGFSNGLVPMLRVFNNTARYVDQGGNKRPGAISIYLEPWHADVFEFLDLKKNTGKEENRARDLFLGLWIPDLFMKRVEENAKWSLFCPNDAPGLQDVWGDEFNALYTKYESESFRVRRVIPAQLLWRAIIDAQIETGIPYMLYKDACNSKSNQKNLGTIKCSNLCTEIIEYTAPDEVAVCNLASIALPSFVTVGNSSFSNCPSRQSPGPHGVLKESSSVSSLPPHSPIDASIGTSLAGNMDANSQFDFNKLHYVTKVITRNLNRVIEVNYYPVEAARKSNMRHRPIGIGVQGLADAFIKMRMSFDEDAARQLNKDIFETIYHAALEASCEIAAEKGAYETYPGCPISQGILQHDMWNVKASDRWDWVELRAKIAQHGVRNSLLVAPMPTASTSQILGNNECFEPYTSNIYTRRVLAGEFQVVNPHLLRTLIDLNHWNDDVKNQIIADNGSVKNIKGIPDEVKHIFRTVWEIPQRSILDMAAERAAFIDQSMSLNIFLAEPSYTKITSMHFHGWKLGLKTGMYYLRTRPAVDAIKFTVDQSKLVKNTKSDDSGPSKDKNAGEKDKEDTGEWDVDLSCSIENRFDCLSCGS